VFSDDPELARKAIAAAMVEVTRAEGLMSAWLPDSEVTRIGKSAGGPPIVVDPEVFEVVERSLLISKESGGAFDITVAALRGVWSVNPEHPRIPTAAEVQAKLPLIDWRKVILDRERHAVGLAAPGMVIDLGGIAKGYAVDLAVAKLKEMGVTIASVNAGGNLRVIGPHLDRPWNVGIQNPRDKDKLIAWLGLSDLAVSTSGDYEKFIEQDGKRYCHIIDPQTGMPVMHTQSVTIVAPDACQADGLSTAVFVLGHEKGMALIESLPGVEGVIIDAEGKRYESSGLKGKVNWLE
jgi:FAD:protein FMN transferase